MNPNADIAAALGQQLWTTDSFLPEYRAGEHGPWRVNPGGPLVTDWGYVSGPRLLEMLPSLSRRVISEDGVDQDEWEVWMSLTPHEIESQELGYRYAFGNVVIMGLGMGWIAANAALNPEVTAVTVVERDPDVISLFQDSGAFDSLAASARCKISIARADALEWTPPINQAVDFLYADIWLHLAEEQTLRQVKRMQANVVAEQVYFWGQEIALNSAMAHISDGNEAMSENTLRQAANNVLGLPLLIPDDRDYVGMIKSVIDNRVKRGLPINFEID